MIKQIRFEKLFCRFKLHQAFNLSLFYFYKTDINFVQYAQKSILIHFLSKEPFKNKKTSLSFIILGCFNNLKLLTSLRSRHYYQLSYFSFIVFTATISPVFTFCALETQPYEPSPKLSIILY